MMVFSWFLGLTTLVIFWIDLEIRILMTLLFVSNLGFLWCMMFTLGFSRTEPKVIDGSFARLRTIVLFSIFFQLVVFVFSFSDGDIGGTCSEDVTLPYGFIALYGLQILSLLWYILEYCFGFGTVRGTRQDAKSAEKTSRGDQADGKKATVDKNIYVAGGDDEI